MSVRNLHRLAGAAEKLRRDALAAACHFCPEPAVGYIEGWDMHPKGLCTMHAEQGRTLGYVVHRSEDA